MRSRLIIFLFSISFFILSCSPETAPPDKDSLQSVDQANRIILAVDKNPRDNYQNVVQYLSEQGFRMHINDASSLNLQTAYKPIDTGEEKRGFIRIHASVIDTMIHFYGDLSSSELDDREIVKPDGKNHLYQQAWQELVDIAEGYPHEEVYYSRN